MADRRLGATHVVSSYTVGVCKITVMHQFSMRYTLELGKFSSTPKTSILDLVKL